MTNTKLDVILTKRKTIKNKDLRKNFIKKKSKSKDKKSVIIVGNAPTNLENEYGKEIDN